MRYYTFMLAKERGQVVGTFLTGQPMPFAAMERYLWTRYDMVTQRLEQQQNKGRGKRGGR